jgi:hypothetical protein
MSGRVAQVRRLIDETAAQSVIVRELIARLGCSDVIVYVEMTASPQIPARAHQARDRPSRRPFPPHRDHTGMSGSDFAPLLGH